MNRAAGRTRKASIIAGFGYLQFALAAVSGIVIVPFVLRSVGVSSYGLWLAAGEVLAYSAMADLGLLGVLPWMLAERDGANDHGSIRRILPNAFAVACAAGVAYAMIAFGILWIAPNIGAVNSASWAQLRGPLFIVVAGHAVSYPFRTFSALLMGLQDVAFSGFLGVLQWLLNLGLIFYLLTSGHGLFALAIAAAVPPVVVSILSTGRAVFIAPDLFRNWERPRLSEMRRLALEGSGSLISAVGWRMVAASNSIILAYTSGPLAVVVYAMTAKLPMMLMQASWMLPDSAMIGLANLYGEHGAERAREVILSMMKLILISAGGVAVIVLALNPSFVRMWTGEKTFGGLGLNAMLAIGVLAQSITHGLFAAAATIGNRLQVGFATLVQGAAFVLIAFPMGYFFGIAGLAAATVIVCVCFAIPVGVKLLNARTSLRLSDMFFHVTRPWALPGMIALASGAIIGLVMRQPGRPLFFIAAVVLPLVYLRSVRPLYDALPFPTTIRRWLLRVRLLTN